MNFQEDDFDFLPNESKIKQKENEHQDIELDVHDNQEKEFQLQRTKSDEDYQINWDQDCEDQQLTGKNGRKKPQKSPKNSENFQINQENIEKTMNGKSGNFTYKFIGIMIIVIIMVKIASQRYSIDTKVKKQYLCSYNFTLLPELNNQLKDNEKELEIPNPFQDLEKQIDNEKAKQKNDQNQNPNQKDNENENEKEIPVLQDQVYQDCENLYMYDYGCFPYCPKNMVVDQSDKICKFQLPDIEKRVQTIRKQEYTYQMITPTNFNRAEKHKYSLVILFHGYNANFNFFQTNTNIVDFSEDYNTVFISYGIKMTDFANTQKIENDIYQIGQEQNFDLYRHRGSIGYDLGGYISIHLALTPLYKLEFSYTISPVIFERYVDSNDQCYFAKNKEIQQFKLDNLVSKLKSFRSQKEILIAIYGGETDPCTESQVSFVEKAKETRNNIVQAVRILEPHFKHNLKDIKNMINNNLLEGIAQYLNSENRDKDFN